MKHHLAQFNMKRYKSSFYTLVLSLMLAGCNPIHHEFSGIEQAHKDFAERRATISDSTYFSVFTPSLNVTQRQALEFLYAYMPLPDIVDYSGDFHLMNVDYALRAREEMPWGKDVPDREFLHFVLPTRVNNENMDESRRVFYEELKERVCTLSMHDAVLEVNHWCHEKVTYQPSDARTSSPLASVRTAFGRCGEESTFTVAALRAVGIPARQVYTPRWAHTDSNHAWVEAWVDGKWRFLGACEPEAVLDLGWFNAPASRGMLMHTKAFGHYEGPEEVVGRTACYTEINVTEGYAPTGVATVRVTDDAGNPVQTEVEFKIFNYAEFYTAAKKPTNSDGVATLTTGKGDLLAWATKDGKFGFAKVSVGDQTDTIDVILNKTSGYTAQVEMDIVPPTERNTVPEQTEAQIAHNKWRFAQEDSIRNAYIATFITSDTVASLAQAWGLNNEALQTVMKEARGNYQAVRDFLAQTPNEERQLALRLLQIIAEKDRRDVPTNVLHDHLKHTPREQTLRQDLFENYVLNPRISNELLTPYKQFFREALDSALVATYKAQPSLWEAWCRDSIQIDNVWNPQALCMSPEGVWKMRQTDKHSRDIFFVAVARSMGIPARIDAVTGKTQYWQANGWKDAQLSVESESEVKNAPWGILQASYKSSPHLDNPKYHTHFSISKIVDGHLVVQNYDRNDTWASLLKKGLMLDAGDYLMVSGTRMADGSVLAHLNFVSIPEWGRVRTELIQRHNEEGLQVIGNFNSENLFFDLETKTERSILSATGRGYYILALIAPNSEPTNHFLRDIAPYKKAFEQWGQKMVLLFADASEAERFQKNDFVDLPNNIVWGTDIRQSNFNEIYTNMKLTNSTRPVIIVADTFNRIVFISQGYSIGLGEQLYKVINKLN